MPALWRRLGQAHVRATIDACVAYAHRCGVYLSLNWHSIGFPPTERYKVLEDIFYGNLFETTTAETHAFWRSMAKRYGQ